MQSKTAVVKISERGRCTIPEEVRKSLGFDGDEVYTEVTVHYDE